MVIYTNMNQKKRQVDATWATSCLYIIGEKKGIVRLLLCMWRQVFSRCRHHGPAL